MFKFFRKIRQSLLADNKISKYLIYAVGEILLVMVGILLALQVNNWNEGRKAKMQEITILENLKEDLNLDTLDIRFNLKYHKQFFQAEEQLLNLLTQVDQENSDSIDFNNALGTLLFTALHKSTFSSLQSNDIGLLHNNILRKKIARFYDYYSQSISDMSNNFEAFKLYERKLPYFKKYFRITDERNVLLAINEDENFFEHNLGKYNIYLFDIDGARADQSFKFILNEVLFFRKAFIDFHEATLEEIDNLTEAIDSELEFLGKGK